MPGEGLWLLDFARHILWPPHTHCSSLFELLAARVLGLLRDARAVGDMRHLTLAPNLDADLLALLALGDLYASVGSRQ